METWGLINQAYYSLVSTLRDDVAHNIPIHIRQPKIPLRTSSAFT